MARLDLYVHGRGRGHATRCSGIAAHLASLGHDLRIFAGRDAAAALAPALAVSRVESLPQRPQLRSLTRLGARTRSAVRRTRAARTELIISDGDLPGLLAARLCGVPSIAVGHGLVFARCVRPDGLSRRRWWREGVKARASSLGASMSVAVNFVPIATRDASTVLARPQVAPRPRTGRDHVLCYFRDGNGEHVVRTVAALGYPAIVYGRLGRSVAGAHVREHDREGFLAALAGARAVVASAGSQLIAECTALGVPIFALHRGDDDEQALNIAMLRRWGLGDGAALSDRFADRLRRFLAHASPPDPPAFDAPDVAEVTARAVQRLLAGAQ